MQRKIFISINLSPRTKKSLTRAISNWQDLPVKWVKEPNLHVTLSFLGHVNDSVIPEICKKVRETAAGHEMMDLEFTRIELAPTKDDPRMVWLLGEPSEELKILHEKIEQALNIFVTSKKTFRPHITLGKIRQKKWHSLPEAPVIEKVFPLLVTAESVDVMASEFEGDGMEYTTIESCPLK